MKKNESATVINLSSIKAACCNCSLVELCLPMGLGENDMDALEQVVKRRRPLKKGDYLYRMGDSLTSLYAVRTGSIKTYELRLDGQLQIMGFHLPGEVIGIDAISSDRHPCNAVALEATELCEIPFNKLVELSHKISGLQRQLLRIMSREIVRDEEALMMLGKMTADERLAACLLSFTQRYQRLGGSADEFKLSMSRQDLADYLGLALETVSRLFSRFQDDGLISVQGKQIHIRDRQRINALAKGIEAEPIAWQRHHNKIDTH